MGTIRRTSALYFVACLDSLRGLFNGSHLGLPLETLCNALSPEYGHPGASLLVRCRGSNAISLCRMPQRVSPRRIFSNTRCDLAPSSSPPYGRSRGSGSTALTLFFCRPYRRPTRSSYGSPRVKSGPELPPV